MKLIKYVIKRVCIYADELAVFVISFINLWLAYDKGFISELFFFKINYVMFEMIKVMVAIQFLICLGIKYKKIPGVQNIEEFNKMIIKFDRERLNYFFIFIFSAVLYAMSDIIYPDWNMSVIASFNIILIVKLFKSLSMTNHILNEFQRHE